MKKQKERGWGNHKEEYISHQNEKKGRFEDGGEAEGGKLNLQEKRALRSTEIPNLQIWREKPTGGKDRCRLQEKKE